jgi:hypothetical protein
LLDVAALVDVVAVAASPAAEPTLADTGAWVLCWVWLAPSVVALDWLSLWVEASLGGVCVCVCAGCGAGAAVCGAGAGCASDGAAVAWAGAGASDGAVLACAGALACAVVVVVELVLDAAGALASEVTELAAAPAEPTATVLEDSDGLELGALVAVELPLPAPELVGLCGLVAGEESDDPTATLAAPEAASLAAPDAASLAAPDAASLVVPDAASLAPPALDPAATVIVD